MRQLTFLFYGEGRRDFRFLPELIERIIETCVENLRMEYEIHPITPIHIPTGKNFEERMRYIESENGFDFVFVHQDIDSDLDNLWQNRWLPWLAKCVRPEMWIPVFPAQSTDSWMLADRTAHAKC